MKSMMKSMPIAFAGVATLLLTASAASALTIANDGSKPITVGIDEGMKEHVEKIPAGKTVTLTGECKDGCGLTGPWGYSWMAKSNDKLVFDKGDLRKGT
jgi:hypothetical protein